MFPGGNSEDEPTRPPHKGRQVGGDAQKVPGLETLETGTHSSTALPAGRRAWRGETASAILGEPRTWEREDASQQGHTRCGPGTGSKQPAWGWALAARQKRLSSNH